MYIPWIWTFIVWQPHSSTLACNIQRTRSLVGCSPWGREELDTTEQLHFHFSLSCIGEGNGNPVQCSCLENPRDGGAWWAPVSGVAQSRTRLKRLSSSSSLALRVEAGSRRAVHLEPFGPTAASLPGPRAPRPRPASAEPLPYLPFSERAGSRRDIVGQFL